MWILIITQKILMKYLFMLIQKNILMNIKSKFRTINNLSEKRLLNAFKYNKRAQYIENISIKDYKDYCEYSKQIILKL